MAELGRDLIPFARDPHHATMLVERMTRVLGRSNNPNWDGIATPAPGKLRAQSPVAWHAKSDPAGAAWHGNSETAGAAWHGTSDPSGAAWKMGVTQSEHATAAPVVSAPAIVSPVPKRRSPVLVVALVAAVAAIGAVVFVFSRPAEPTAEAPPPPPTHVAAPALPPANVVAPEPSPPANVVAPAADPGTSLAPASTGELTPSPAPIADAKRPPSTSLSRGTVVKKLKVKPHGEIKPPSVRSSPAHAPAPSPTPAPARNVKRDPFDHPRAEK
jgi:hypothetical protein